MAQVGDDEKTEGKTEVNNIDPESIHSHFVIDIDVAIVDAHSRL